MSDYFGKDVILWNCPKCTEAKILGNKYYRMMDNVLDRMAECAEGMTTENCETEAKRLNGLSDKFDKIQKEFVGILKGRVKCGCEPAYRLDDYLEIWGLTEKKPEVKPE